MDQTLEKSITATLHYFSIFVYPLTILEVWRYLYMPQPLTQCITVLDVARALAISKEISCDRGFYFIKGQHNLVETRMRRLVYSQRKLKKAARFVRFARIFPFVSMIAVVNTLAFHNAKNESDIDLFVVTEPGRVWTTRFLLTFPLKLLRERTGQKKIPHDPFCLSFFSDYNNMAFQTVQLDKDDIYLRYWIAQLRPLHQKYNMYKKFIHKNNWIEYTLPHSLCVFQEPTTVKETHTDFAADWIEVLLQKIQKKIFPKRITTIAAVGRTDVIFSDTMIKLHTHDRRKEYYHAWKKRLGQIA